MLVVYLVIAQTLKIKLFYSTQVWTCGRHFYFFLTDGENWDKAGSCSKPNANHIHIHDYGWELFYQQWMHWQRAYNLKVCGDFSFSPSHILFCQFFFFKLFSLFINLLFVCIFNGCPTLPHLSHFTPLDVPLHPGLSQVTPKLRVSKIINYTKWHDVEVSQNAPLYTPVSIVIVLWSWLGLTKYFQSYKESFLA